MAMHCPRSRQSRARDTSILLGLQCRRVTTIKLYAVSEQQRCYDAHRKGMHEVQNIG